MLIHHKDQLSNPFYGHNGDQKAIHQQDTDARAPQLGQQRLASNIDTKDDIAIIGMAGIFPQAQKLSRSMA